MDAADAIVATDTTDMFVASRVLGRSLAPWHSAGSSVLSPSQLPEPERRAPLELLAPPPKLPEDGSAPELSPPLEG
jgi:hypothetical protein